MGGVARECHKACLTRCLIEQTQFGYSLQFLVLRFQFGRGLPFYQFFTAADFLPKLSRSHRPTMVAAFCALCSLFFACAFSTQSLNPTFHT